MVSPVDLISPHGGSLTHQIPAEKERSALLKKAAAFPVIPIDEWSFRDLEMIAIGGFSPLKGFLTSADYQEVVSKMRLSDGTVWPIPIVLDVNKKQKESCKIGQPASLVFKGNIVGTIQVEDIFSFDKKKEAQNVFRTEDDKHPGVERIHQRKDFLVGGTITLLDRFPHEDQFGDYNLTPEETREQFQQRGWKEIVGFQTRNPMHRAHEYITKSALEIVDGLFIHPIVGFTKKGDLPAKLRIKCYEALIENYYAKNRVFMSINPSNMYYAGPREAVLHALVRQNYGCSHFIVGRDHAGVGQTYGTYDAQELLKSFSRAEVAIQPLCFENSFWDQKTQGMATDKTSPSAPDQRRFLSGSEIRRALKAGEKISEEYIRPEVAKILKEYKQ